MQTYDDTTGDMLEASTGVSAPLVETIDALVGLHVDLQIYIVGVPEEFHVQVGKLSGGIVGNNGKLDSIIQTAYTPNICSKFKKGRTQHLFDIGLK